KLLQHVDRLVELDDLGGWLYRVTANLALSRLRQERSLVRRLLGAATAIGGRLEPSTEEVLEQHETARQVIAAVAALHARERVIVCMKVYDGKRQREIAGALGLSEGAVSKLLDRAWARLKAAGWDVNDARA